MRKEISDEMVEAAAKELLAHGEFGTTEGANRANVVVAAGAALSAALDVVVKPLKWENGQFSERLPRFAAHTMVGYYKVLEWSSGGFGGTMPPLERGCEPREFMADSLEEAKAAAQADYERRILSALSLSVVESEPVAWTEDRLRAEAKRRGWYVRESASVPNIDGGWWHPFTVTASSHELCELLNAPPRLQEKTDEE